MSNRIRSALFFDIDGTILSEITRQIPESALEALIRARENGHLLFINTGRTWCALPKEVKEAPFDGFLCGCGTYLTYQGEVLFFSSIPEKRGIRILEKMEECGIEGLCEAAADVYYPRHKTRFPELEQIKQYYQSCGLGNTSFLENRELPFTVEEYNVTTE